MSVVAGELFVRLKIPRLFVPEAGKRTAARIARDFGMFIDGVTEKFNERCLPCGDCSRAGQVREDCNLCKGTGYFPPPLSSAEGLVMLLNSGKRPADLFEQNPSDAIQGKNAINQSWGKVAGFKNGYKFMNPRFAEWFVYNALPHPYRIDNITEFSGRPDLSKALIENPGGIEWMNEFVVHLRQLIYGR